jgi:flagellin-like hook-associated protein FlgL
MADSVSLTASIRSNLLSLQDTNDLLEQTTTRLSTGEEVSTAVDNPTNYFTALNYNDRAEGLEARLDGMGEAIQQINAADNGITTLRSFLSQMKGVVNDALAESSSTSRQDLGKQFNELIYQASEVVNDSEYGGSNLLTNQDSVTVQFNELNGESELTVQGFNISANTSGVDDTSGELNAAVGFKADGTSVGNGTAGTSGEATSYAFVLNTGDTTGSSFLGIKSHGVTGASTSYTSTTTHEIDWGYTVTGSDKGWKNNLEGVIEQIEAMDEQLKTQASKLANNLAVITQREDFTNEQINILKEGADNLTLADLNEEGANLLALQTSSSLGIQALSLASESSQNVLRIIG